MPREIGRVLIIAGSDSGGGAGIQADIKTVTALGGYAATAITALTAQNTRGVFGIHEVPTDFLRQQIELVLEDIGADALKTGMLHSAAVIQTVADAIASYRIPLVLDPVMVAKGGAPLLQPDAIDTLRSRLLPMAEIATPNIPEAEILSGTKITTPSDMEKAGRQILSLGPKAILMKGGHLLSDNVIDILVTPTSIQHFENKRIQTTSTHGTGCTLASGIATGLAKGMPLIQAVSLAREYVRKAMETAPGLGHGHGPLNHAHTVKV